MSADCILACSRQLKKPTTVPNGVSKQWPNLIPVNQLQKRTQFLGHLYTEGRKLKRAPQGMGCWSHKKGNKRTERRRRHYWKLCWCGKKSGLSSSVCPVSLHLLLELSGRFRCPVAHSCLTLCDPMDRSTPGLPVHHHLPEFTQTHVHRVGDAIQPSHPLSSPSPPALNLSQHQIFFPVSRLLASGGQSIGASASVLPMKIQGWFLLGLFHR